MSVDKNNDKLDELIAKTINNEKPQFDAEKWKDKYPDEYKKLISRRDKTETHRPFILKVILGKPIVKLAAAAAIVIVVGLLLNRDGQDQKDPIERPPIFSQSPAQMVSMASMRMTYQRGGLDALDQQFRDTLDVFGPRSSSVSIQELL
jgi:hypothetical protein